MQDRQLWRQQDALTDPGAFAEAFRDLPDDPAQLRRIVSELIVHLSWTAHYGIAASSPSRDTLPVAERLRLTLAAAPMSLTSARPADRRTFGTCRDYALVLCGMLRHQGRSARVRCGFASYFTASPHEDHWICEYWSDSAARWIRTDAQIDDHQRAHLGLTFDCADLPDDAFLSAGQAWRRVRAGDARPGDFGHAAARGLWFLRVNVHRDLLAMANQHTSAWDTWRNSTPASKSLSQSELEAVDALANDIAGVERGALPIAALQRVAPTLLPPWQG
jgi:hypothetical protein